MRVCKKHKAYMYCYMLELLYAYVLYNMYLVGTYKGTIYILCQCNFWLILTQPPTIYVSINTVQNVTKFGHFLGQPTQSFCWRNISMIPTYDAVRITLGAIWSNIEPFGLSFITISQEIRNSMNHLWISGTIESPINAHPWIHFLGY